LVIFFVLSVGENTFPNAVSFISGYSLEDLQKICYCSRQTPQDDCPYIWKRFGAALYFTAFLEDSPAMATFNFLKTGFLTQPVDFYIRPFMQSMYDEKHFPGTVILNFVPNHTNDFGFPSITFDGYYSVKNVTGIFSCLFSISLVENETKSDRNPVIFLSNTMEIL